MSGPERQTDLKRPRPGSSWHSPRDCVQGPWLRAERAQPACLQAGPLGPRRPLPAPRQEPRPSQAGPHAAVPFPTGPQETTRAPRQAQRPRPQWNREAPHPSKPEIQPVEGPRGPASRNFLLPPARLAVAHAWLPALSLCARQQIGSGLAAGRAGSEDGRLPGDCGPRSAASCRGGGRAGAEGPRADRPPPRLGRGCSGRLPRRGRLRRRVVKFSLGGWGGKHKSQGRQAALALPGQPPAWAWFLLLWAPLEAFSTFSAQLPHRCAFRPGAASLENPISTRAPKVPTQSTRSPILGLPAVMGPPGPGSMDTARS